MSFPRYPAYKDSGVEWLGEVPAHWDVKRLGHYFSERREKVSDQDYEPLSVTKNGVLPQLDTAAKTNDGDNRKLVLRGDFVINSRSDRKGSSGLSDRDGSVSLINTVLQPYEQMAGEFAHHLLRSVSFQEEYYRYGRGIVADLWSTNYSEMKNIILAVPSHTEQSQIASFLDHETAKIDALVAEQERLIELLKEKRQAVISHAVTKGLDSSVPMKDSGVEWLGEVPAHWEVRQVRSIASFLTSGPRGWSERVGEEGSLFVQSGDLTDDLSIAFSQAKRVAVENDAEAARTRLLVGDVVVCITGAKTGNVAVCDAVEEDAYINQHLCLIRPKADVLPRFLGVFLKSDAGQRYFGIAQYGLKQGLSLENVKATPLVVPPISEQEALLKAVTHASTQMDQLIGEAVLSIELLRERRTALISAAATGQIDVRNLASFLPA